MNGNKLRRWPLAFIALPAAVAIWNGWVGLGGMTGFGPVHPLPGIRPGLVINTAITLPVGLEAYAAYALAAWLGPWQVSARARRFAMWSALGSLGLGMTGQIAFHLLTAWHQRTAPGFVIVLVACVPVAVVGLASGLTHLLRERAADADEVSLPVSPHPLVVALAARITPRPATGPATPPAAIGDTEDDTDAPELATDGATPGDTGNDADSDTETTAEPTTTATPEATGTAPDSRQDSRQPRRRQPARKTPAWHAKARRIVAKDPAISAAELGEKCGVNVRSAQRYLADHPPLIHAVQDQAEQA